MKLVLCCFGCADSGVAQFAAETRSTFLNGHGSAPEHRPRKVRLPEHAHQQSQGSVFQMLLDVYCGERPRGEREPHGCLQRVASGKGKGERERERERERGVCV